LYLRRGNWNGKQLVSEKWIRLATTPCEIRPDYGYMWWLNTNQTRYPGVPASAFAALGSGTSICLVDPDDDLVVVVRWVDDRKVAELLKRIVASVQHKQG
jgi:CubicO group peptidase (beta-lactamase class C family)